MTESLKILPKNQRIIIEREEEKERLMLLQEAKVELWRKWRQRRGRTPKIDEIKELGKALMRKNRRGM